MALYEMKYENGMKISVSKGNNKIGKKVHTFNTLPGSSPIETTTKGMLTSIKGTCHGCCEGTCENGGCYAIRDCKLHHNSVIPAVLKNTLILRHDIDDCFNQLKEYCVNNKVEYFRVHSSGELDSYEELEKLVWLANECPSIHFCIYTKRFEWVKQYLDTNKKFPENLAVNLSKWMDNMKDYMDIPDINIFAFDSGEDEEIKDWAVCPAVAKKPGAKKGYETGVTCSQCLRCYRKGNTKTRVYNH